MKKRIVTVIILMLGVTSMACGQSGYSELKSKDSTVLADDSSKESTEQIYEGMDKVNEFGLDLLKNSMSEENPLVSPISAYFALNMVAEGSEGNTKKEFEDVLGSLEYQEQVISKTRKGLIKDSEGMTFKINDSVWIDNDFEVSQEWIDKVLAHEGNQAFSVNLEDESTVKKVNNWIEDSTNGLIKDMIKEPFSSDDRLVLFDALYMKGKWLQSFDEYMTYDDEFKIDNIKTEDVPTMHMYEKYFDYINNGNFEGVVLPYKDSNLSFIAIKPVNKQEYIKDIIKDMDYKDILNSLESAENRCLSISLPVLDIKSELSLVEPLKNMGIKDAFLDGVANFSKIGTEKYNNSLFISSVQQNARIKLDEDGTEAAAVTEIKMGVNSIGVTTDTPYEIFFKEPFLYLIMDMENKVPTFAGVIDNPSAQ